MAGPNGSFKETNFNNISYDKRKTPNHPSVGTEEHRFQQSLVHENSYRV